ncbi:MAG: DUF6265 family protein [Brevundimonas sp.]|uniref:DUF6265 family protein n=1 Tax=Brevundimonas sp. TaxID=1871086 RepID=UPI00391B01C8
MLTALIAAVALDAALRPNLDWMSGYWLACDAGREVSEVWTDPRLGLMAGVTVTVRGDRVGFEQSRITPADDTPTAPLAYFAQPGGAPATVFPVVSSGPGRVVFEQAADDDFPKRIIYERDGDALNARIEGEIDGRQQTVRWAFRKAPLNARCPA